MSQSSRFALRALQSIQKRPVQTLIPRVYTVFQPSNSSTRTFFTRPQNLAQASAPGSSTANAEATERSLQTEGSLPTLNESDPSKVDWSRSFHGLSQEAFPKDAAEILLAPIDPHIIEVKPDGIIYLPEIHYRRILNRAFGPGAWGLAPRGETIVTDKAVTREYALVAHGRLVSNQVLAHRICI